MPSSIRSHDVLELVVRDEAERHGWQASFSGRDVDQLDLYFGVPKRAPGHGDVLMAHALSGAQVSWEYELPEDEEELRAHVRALVRADVVDRDRRRNPARARSPIEV